ncbi:hypothetical protein [Hymenobacter qilianensis]
MQLLFYWFRCSLLLAFLLGLSVDTIAQKKPLPAYVVTAGGDTLRGAIVPAPRLTQQYQVEFIPIRGHQRLFLDGYQLASFTYYADLDTIRYVSLLFAQKGTNTLCRGFLQQVVAGEAQLYHYSFNHVRQGLPVSNNGRSGSSYSNPKDPNPGNIYASLRGGSWQENARIISNRDGNHSTSGPLSKRGVYNPKNSLVIYRTDKLQLEDVSGWRFPKDAVTYFSDCPEVVADLKSGQYRARDIPQIVRRYNAWHQAQKPVH